MKRSLVGRTVFALAAISSCLVSTARAGGDPRSAEKAATVVAAYFTVSGEERVLELFRTALGEKLPGMCELVREGKGHAGNAPGTGKVMKPKGGGSGGLQHVYICKSPDGTEVVAFAQAVAKAVKELPGDLIDAKRRPRLISSVMQIVAVTPEGECGTKWCILTNKYVKSKSSRICAPC